MLKKLTASIHRGYKLQYAGYLEIDQEPNDKSLAKTTGTTGNQQAGRELNVM